MNQAQKAKYMVLQEEGRETQDSIEEIKDLTYGLGRRNEKILENEGGRPPLGRRPLGLVFGHTMSIQFEQ